MLPAHIAQEIQERRAARPAHRGENWPALFRSEAAWQLCGRHPPDYKGYSLCSTCRFGDYASLCEECHHVIAKALIPDLCDVCAYAGVLYSCMPCTRKLLIAFHGVCDSCVDVGVQVVHGPVPDDYEPRFNSFPCGHCWAARRAEDPPIEYVPGQVPEHDQLVKWTKELTGEARERIKSRSWKNQPPIDQDEFDAMIKHIAEFSDCLTVSQLSQLTLALTHHSLPKEHIEPTAGTVFQPTAGLTVTHRVHPTEASKELQVDTLGFGDLVIRFFHYPTNIYVRVLVRAGANYRKLDVVNAEQFSGNDALGTPRWDTIEDQALTSQIVAEAALLFAVHNVGRGGGIPVDLQATKRVEHLGGPTVSGLAASYGFTLFGR